MFLFIREVGLTNNAKHFKGEHGCLQACQIISLVHIGRLKLFNMPYVYPFPFKIALHYAVCSLQCRLSDLNATQLNTDRRMIDINRNLIFHPLEQTSSAFKKIATY